MRQFANMKGCPFCGSHKRHRLESVTSGLRISRPLRMKMRALGLKFKSPEVK